MSVCQKPRDISHSELEDLVNRDEDKAEKIFEEIWSEARSYLEKHDMNTKQDLTVSLNPKFSENYSLDGSQDRTAYNPLEQEIMLSTEYDESQDERILCNNESSVFSMLVHEGTHAHQTDKLIEFSEEINQILFNAFNHIDIEQEKPKDFLRLENDYKWSALMSQSPNRVKKIVENTNEEYEKWNKKYLEATSELKETELVTLVNERDLVVTPNMTGSKGEWNSEEYREHLLSLQDSDVVELEDLDVSKKRYREIAESHIATYEEVRDKLNKSYKNKEKVKDLFGRSMERELEIENIDTEKHGEKFYEAFSCFLQYCAERRTLGDNEEVRRYVNELNGYAKYNSAKDVAERIFRRAEETEGIMEDKVSAGLELQDQVFQRGQNILSN